MTSHRSDQTLDAQVRALKYRRASLDRFGHMSSIKNQDWAIDAQFRHEGWVEAGDYADNGRSGSKLSVVRREFERMMSDIETRAVECDLIVAYDTSRLFRNRRDKLRLEALFDRGVYIYDVRYGIDTRTSAGRMMFSLLAEIAIDRAEELAEYQRISHLRRKEQGLPSKSGRAGFGHRVVRDENRRWTGQELVPHEAAAIRWAKEELLAGKTGAHCIRGWNDPDHPHFAPPQRTTRWEHDAFRRVMTAARIAGLHRQPRRIR